MVVCRSARGGEFAHASRTLAIGATVHAGDGCVYDLRVTVERIEGRSVCGLAVGDFFEVTESSRVRIPDGKHFCLFAMQSVLALLPAKMRRLPDEDWSSRTRSSRAPTPTSGSSCASSGSASARSSPRLT